MGKDWLYNKGTTTTTTSRSNKKGRRLEKREEQVSSAGCMCAVFQIFDLPSYFHLAPLNQQSPPPSLTKQQQQPVVKGSEAPRTRLDLEEPIHVEHKSTASTSSTMNLEEKENLNIPVGIQIRTSIDSKSARVSTSTSRGGKIDEVSSECGSSYSPGIRTPTLVARLMGLDDLLPQNNSSPLSTNTPSPLSYMNPHQGCYRSNNHTNITGTMSLPETPRGSSDSRRSDVDHHRLSLQINKQINIGEESEVSADYNGKKMGRRRRDDKLRQDDAENTSPGYYARQIVKQVKERVSRKVGLIDITNTIRSKDDQIVLLKPMKQCNNDGNNSSISKHSTPSCSPRLEPQLGKSVTTSTGNKTQTLHSPRLSPLSPYQDNYSLPTKIITKPKSQDSSVNQQLHQNTTKKGKGSIKWGSTPCLQESFHSQRLNLRPSVNGEDHITSIQSHTLVIGEISNSHLKRRTKSSDPIRSKKEEQFGRSTNKANITDKNKCKKTALSSKLNPNVFPLNKDPSPAPTKLLIKQYFQEEPERSTQQLSSQSNKNTCNVTTASTEEKELFQFIQRVVRRTGIDKNTPLLSLTKSQSHPLDPSIFHHFELFHPSIFFTSTFLSQRCNRKLIFQLVDELLVEILEPYISSNPWAWRLCRPMHGLELIEMLCARIQSFPSANCQVLEDIDALIDKDLKKMEVGLRSAFLNDGESIVVEIERNIFESLVHESVVVFNAIELEH